MKFIAIVEDNPDDSSVLSGHIVRYTAENNIPCSVSVYENGMDFLTDYKPVFDVVFMDIEMPFFDGLATAKKLRETDKYVGIVFITNMAQYAINGYEVGALDFILKPVTYYNFADKLNKAFSRLRLRDEKELVIKLCDTNIVRLLISDIFYLEKEKNYIVFHTACGEYRQRGTIKNITEELQGSNFSKCNIGCMVNLSHVMKTTKATVCIRNDELPVSRQYRKKFMDDLMRYLGGK